MFTFEFDHFHSLSQLYSEWRQNFKISQFSRFLLRSKYVIQVTTWKWLNLLKSVPFIKKTLLNQVYIRIWSSWLTFTVLHWMKANFKISQIFKIFAKVQAWDLAQNSIMTETS